MSSGLWALIVVGAGMILALVVLPEIFKARKRPLGQRRQFLPRHTGKM